MRNILFAQNQYHAQLTASGVMQGEIHAVSKGQTAGGVAPYGLKVIGKRFEINDKEAEAVRIIFKMTAEKRSYKDIVSTLETEGYRTRDGKPFSYSTISTMLRNDKYCGTFVYNREGSKRKKNRVLVEKFKEVRNDNAIPAIISKKLFDEVQKIIEHRKESCPKQNVHADYLLTGLIRCASCGTSMSGLANYGNRNKVKIRTYACPKHGTRKGKACSTKAINAEYLELVVKRALVKKFNEYLATIEAKSVFESLQTELAQKQKQSKKRADELRIECKKCLTRAIDATNPNLVSLYESRANDAQELAIQYQAQVKQVQSRIDSLEHVKNEFESNRTQLTIEDVFYDNEITRKLIRACVKEIVVDDANDNIEIVFN